MMQNKRVRVRLLRDMRPNGRQGANIVITEAAARLLIEKGEAEDMRPFPPPDVAPKVPVHAQAPEAKRRPILSPARPYHTRKRGSAT